MHSGNENNITSLQKLVVCQSAVIIIWVIFAQDLRTLGYIIMAADEVENENQTHIPNRTNSLRNRLAQVFILQNPNTSRVCSPMGVVVSLGQLAPGASEDSLKELQTTIGVEDQDRFENYFKLVMENLGNATGIEITFLSKIFVSNLFTLNPEYEAHIRNIFKSEVEIVDFSNILETIKMINNLIKEESGEQISEVVNSLSNTSDVVVISAVCFKGTWERKFTRVVSWLFQNPSVSIQVQMMVKSDILKVRYSSELNAKMLELPYIGKKSKMIIVLPNEVDGLTRLLHIIDEDPFNFDNELQQLGNTLPMLVNLLLPKFKIRTESNLKPLLRLVRNIILTKDNEIILVQCKFGSQLGINLIFNKDVGLSHIANESSAYVNKVLQHTIIEVNQIFPKTAYIDDGSVFSDAEHLSFIADHPFMFLVRLEDETILAGNYNGERANVNYGPNIENV